MPEETVPEAETYLKALLARIHRDGGHYLAEHGLEKAVHDADEIVAELNADYDRLRELADGMAEELEHYSTASRAYEAYAEFKKEDGK